MKHLIVLNMENNWFSFGQTLFRENTLKEIPTYWTSTSVFIIFVQCAPQSTNQGWRSVYAEIKFPIKEKHMFKILLELKKKLSMNYAVKISI